MTYFCDHGSLSFEEKILFDMQNILIKKPIVTQSICGTLQDLEIIFSNILDIYEFTANLLSSVEEQMEVAAENETLTVGICFLDMAEVET